MQWEQEINACVEEGSLRVFVYYADRVNVREEDFKGIDVVLTTYPVVEAEWRKIINATLGGVSMVREKVSASIDGDALEIFLRT